MTKRTRKNIFYSLCLVFVMAGIFVVLYAQGWRLDFETFRFEKVGGLYLRSLPKDASIFLNDKYVDKNPGLLDSGRFISDLFPRNYELKLTSNGYDDWMEHIQINPSLVSEFKYIVLIPKNADVAYKGAVNGFSADNNQVIVNSNSSLSADGKRIRGNKLIFQNGDSQTAFTENTATKTYFADYLRGSSPTSTVVIPRLAGRTAEIQNIREMLQDPSSDGSAIFNTASQVFRLDIKTGNAAQLALSSQTITEMTVSPSWIAWINYNQKTGKSKISFYNRSSSSVQNETEIPGTAAAISFGRDDEIGMLQDNGEFYLITSAGKLQKMAGGVRDFAFSKTGNLVALLEQQTVEIFSLSGNPGYWRFRLPDTDKIRSIEWYWDENHLFIVYPGEIKFLDMSDRNIENFQTAATGSDPEYDVKSNSLYFISDGALRKITFPR